MKKFASILSLAIISFSVFMFASCAKKEQANTLQFSGVFQSAEGHLYLQIDNLADYDSNDYFDYTIDGGETWKNCSHYNRQFFETDKALLVADAEMYSPELVNKTLSVGVRLAETQKYKASPASNLIEYKFKPISEVVEIFSKWGDERTDNYSAGKGWGITAYKFCEKDNMTYKIEKYDYADSQTDEYTYDYTYVEDNWDKNAIKFEYKFVSHDTVFYGGEYYYTGYKDYEDIVNSNDWVDYDVNVGITSAMYASHVINNDAGCIGCYNRTFTVLIRAKATETNLASVCSPVTICLETIQGEIPA